MDNSRHEPDELYTLRNLFWLGNFQLAINEANSLSRIPAALHPERDEFVYRSYLALGQHNIVLSEVKDAPSTPIGIRAIKVLASFMADPSTLETAQMQIQEWLNEAKDYNTLSLVSAILYSHANNIKDALKSLKNPKTMEHHALLVQLYLKMDRHDLAMKELKILKTKDEDACLTQLATAWTNLYIGGTKCQEASYIYEELIDKFGGSSILLNGLAVSKMHQGLFEEAENTLQEALTKSQSDPDTLANLICVSQHLNRAPEIVNRYISQLKIKNPDHPLISSLGIFESAFDRVAATLS